jgi:hypothetical protein
MWLVRDSSSLTVTKSVTLLGLRTNFAFRRKLIYSGNRFLQPPEHRHQSSRHFPAKLSVAELTQGSACRELPTQPKSAVSDKELALSDGIEEV